MIFDVFVQKLQAAGYRPGADLFIDTIPGTINKAIMLRTTLAGIAIDPHIPNRYRGPLQVVVRDVDATDGLRRAKEIQRLITLDRREYHPANPAAGRGPVHLDLCSPKTLPVRYPRLDGNGLEWSQMFDVLWGEGQ